MERKHEKFLRLLDVPGTRSTRCMQILSRIILSRGPQIHERFFRIHDKFSYECDTVRRESGKQERFLAKSCSTNRFNLGEALRTLNSSALLFA